MTQLGKYCSECGSKLSSSGSGGNTTKTASSRSKSKKKSPSAYNKRYSAAFKKLAPKYKTKAGTWKKNGYRSAVRAAHKAVKK